MRRPLPLLVGGAAVLALSFTACRSIPATPATTAASGAVSVQVGSGACGRGWHAPAAGTQRLRLTNGGVAGTEVELQEPTSKRVYLDVEALGAGASITTEVVLAPGTYRLVCLAADEDPEYGPSVVVPKGTVDRPLTPGIVPVTRNELIVAAKTYGAWIAGRLPTLAAQVAALDHDAAAGDLGAARRDWTTAHATYRTLGGAYGAFGSLGEAIDGAPRAGTSASSDASLEGFQRVEALLWAPRASARTVAVHTKRLVTAVAALRSRLGTLQIDPADVGLRAHEILEDALQFDLTGAENQPSGTALADVAAEISGTDAALRPLRPILAAHHVQLTDVDAALSRLRALVASFHSGGAWKRIGDLSRTERERLDAAVSDAVERLARVAALCDPRRDL